MKQVAVIGLGTFGQNLVKFLTKAEFEVIAIDKDEMKVQEVSEIAAQAIQADSTDEKTLTELGIANMDVVIIGIGQNLEASILVTMILKSMGAKNVIAKALSSLHANVLRKIGADRIIFPERDVAEKLAKSLESSNIVDTIILSSVYSLMELKAPKGLVGRNLKEAEVRKKFGINVVAIKRKVPFITDDEQTDFKEDVNISPNADDNIEEGDILVIIGQNEEIEKMKRIK
ncbi:potassium channel family protein [bacterium]